MADLNRKMAEGHTVSDLDTVIDEVYGAHGDYDTLGDRLDDIDTIIDTAKLGIHYKGEVNYYSNLPTTGVSIGDAYTVKYAGSSGTTPDGTEYVWGTVSGTNQWINFSKDSYTKAEVDALLAIKQNALTTAQLAAVNSGIDSEKVAQIETNKSNISLLETMNGAKNHLNSNAQSSTMNNIIFTVQSDKSIRVISTDAASALSYFMLYGDTNNYYENVYKDMVLCGSPSIVGSSTCFFRVVYSTTGSSQSKYDDIITSDGYTIDNSYDYIKILIICQSGYNPGADGIIFKPMIIDSSMYNAGFTDYQPYAMSNAQLTAAIQAIQAQLANQ